MSAVPNEVHLSPHHGVRRNQTLGIVIHSTRSGLSGRELEYQRTVNWFANPSAQVSAHRVIGISEGQHCLCVEDDIECWGAREYNRTHLQIELAQPRPTDEYSDYQYSCAAAVVKGWATKYNFPLDRKHIQGHDEIPPGKVEGKTDPGALFDWDKFMGLL